jgi:hypothetical protein
MKQYRHRPTVTRAAQYFASQLPEDRPEGVQVQFGEGKPFVVTVHGERAYLVDGDYVVAEPDGEHFYPCKSDIFVSHYEEMAGEEPQIEVGVPRSRR